MGLFGAKYKRIQAHQFPALPFEHKTEILFTRAIPYRAGRSFVGIPFARWLNLNRFQG